MPSWGGVAEQALCRAAIRARATRPGVSNFVDRAVKTRCAWPRQPGLLRCGARFAANPAAWDHARPGFELRLKIFWEPVSPWRNAHSPPEQQRPCTSYPRKAAGVHPSCKKTALCGSFAVVLRARTARIGSFVPAIPSLRDRPRSPEPICTAPPAADGSNSRPLPASPSPAGPVMPAALPAPPFCAPRPWRAQSRPPAPRDSASGPHRSMRAPRRGGRPLPGRRP